MRAVLAPTVALFLGCGSANDTGPARDTITAEALRTDVELLASDAFLGRGTGERGAELAAAHVAAVFGSAGLVPLPGQEGFEIPYTLYRQGWDRGSSLTLSLSGGEQDPRLGADFRPFHFSDGGEVEGELVFAGYGITSPELQYDDYADLDVSGKIVVLLRHDPREAEGGEPWVSHAGHALFTSKARNAAEHGAVGMILVTDPLNGQRADDLRIGERVQLEPPKERPQSRREDTGDAPFLAVHASQPVGEALVSALGKSLSELQTALNRGESVNGPIDGAKARIALSRQKEPETLVASNVVGFLPGTDPDLAEQWVVIGAHFDHLGAFEGHGDTVYNGADDNASGTAGLLALARAFVALPAAARPKRSVVFAGFSGEELGLLGSRALVEGGTLPTGKVSFMLNLDMIGRGDGEVELIGDGYGTGLSEAALAAAAGLELVVDLGGAEYRGSSDHHPFREADVPFLFFSTGLHDDYHQLEDHADKVNFDQMQRIVQLGFAVANQVASGALTPRFVHHITWLGLEVELAERDGNLRAIISAVEPNSRAPRAGFAVGDAIYGFGDARLEDAAAVGAGFRAIEPGATSRITVDRAHSRMTFDVARAKTGYLGVWPGDLTDELRASNGLKGDEGVLLRNVIEGTPAEAAGLRSGDALIAIGGIPTSLGSLSLTLTRIGAGETVPVTVIRAGERLDLPLTLGERPERP